MIPGISLLNLITSTWHPFRCLQDAWRGDGARLTRNRAAFIDFTEFYRNSCQPTTEVSSGTHVADTRRIKANREWTSTKGERHACICLLYTSDAADERSSVDLGGR